MEDHGTTFVEIVNWVEAILLGPAAASVAVIAVAYVGFAMITGRVDVPHAVRVVLGCFIIFGASTIAAGIRVALPGTEIGGEAMSVAPAEMADTLPPAQENPEAPPRSYDPYAGAAVGARDNKASQRSISGDF
jgi:hypothetical protein